MNTPILSPSSNAEIADNALRVSMFVALFGAYWLPLAEEKAASLVAAIAIASFIFLFEDIRQRRSRINYVACVSSVVIFVSFIVGWLYFVSKEFPQLQYEAWDWYRQHGISLAASCFSAAIVEEIAFRRCLQNLLQRFLSMNWAIFISASMFMYAHGFFSFHLLFSGIAFGVLANHLGAIYAAIIIHSLINFLGTARLNLTGAVDELGFSTALALGGSSGIAQLCSMALLTLFMFGRALYRRWRR